MTNRRIAGREEAWDKGMLHAFRRMTCSEEDGVGFQHAASLKAYGLFCHWCCSCVCVCVFFICILGDI